jgi:small conductance mechanosensitive channel
MVKGITAFLAGVSWTQIITRAGSAVMVIIAAWLVTAVVRMALRRFERRLVAKAQGEGDIPTEASKRAETLTRMLRHATVIGIWAVALLTVLSEIGVDMGPVLASAGIVGLAVGFGAQNLVRDVISGFFLILEDQVRVGDVAIVNGTGGLVEKLTLRTLVLRDLGGVVHVFPNGTINTLSNATKQWSAYVCEIGVAYKEDTDRVVEIMKAVGSKLREDDYFGPLIIEDLEVFGVDKFADSAVIIKGRLKTLPIKQWEVGRELLRRLKKAFDEQGVEIPFPHRSVYFGEASKPFLAKLSQGPSEEVATRDA